MKSKSCRLKALITIVLMLSAGYAFICPAESLPANSMWIQPRSLSFSTMFKSVGDKFNVTVWLNVTSLTTYWQFYLVYNKTQLSFTRCGFTSNGKSQWSGTFPTDSPPPSNGEHNATFDYVIFGEALKNSAEKIGSGSLSWVEFEILQTPAENQTITSELRLDIGGVFQSWIMDKDFNAIPLSFGKATYTYVYSAGAMWIEPEILTFYTGLTRVGDRFNVTVWLNVTSPTNCWQFYLVYNKTQIDATRCGYTGNGKSQWAGAFPTDNPPASFGPHNGTHNFVWHGEVLKNSAEKIGSGSLSWVEFEILQAPGENQTITSELRLDIRGGAFYSMAMDKDFVEIPLSFHKSTYEYVFGYFPNTIYVEPETIVLYTSLILVGGKFNVTVWLNATTLTNSWQFYLVYNKTQLSAVRCGYTGIDKSLWSGTVPVDTALASFGSHNATHDYVVHSEVLRNSIEIIGAGGLSWVEFEILQAPGENQTITSELRLDLVGSLRSLTLDRNYDELPLNFRKASYTYSSPPDVAITNVSPVWDVIPRNSNASISVIVENQGKTTEPFNVTCYANARIIQTQEVANLKPGEERTLGFTWNTVGIEAGTYKISANTTTIPAESDILDNEYQNGLVTVVDVPNGISVLPKHSVFHAATTPIHSKFNVTVWAGNVSNVFGYQFAIPYDATLLSITRVWGAPTFHPLYLFHDRPLDQIVGPLVCFDPYFGVIVGAFLNTQIEPPPFSSGTGLLSIVEFEIIYVPPSGSVSSVFNLHNCWTLLIAPPYPYPEIPVSATDGYYKYDSYTHDVAVTDVHSLKTSGSPIPIVCRGMNMQIFATVKNQGDTAESFEVTAFANNTIIGARTVTLNPNENVSLTFVWQTSSLVEYSKYTISVHASQIPGETNMSNNALVDCTITVTHMGDITGDGKVDIQDIARVSGGFGCIRINDPLSPKYGQYWHPVPCPTCPHTPNADINGDKVIDVQDLSRTSGNYGWHQA